MVMQNKAMEALAELQPKSREEFIEIKGLGERKYDQYGLEILDILHPENHIKEIKSEQTESISLFESLSDNSLTDIISKKVLSVSQMLDLVKEVLRPLQFRVQGEISSFKLQRHLYFSLKDAQDESKMDAIMWESDLKYCGIDPREGLEVIVQGYMDIYKPSGKASFIAQTMELVGEGALKKAYDELKNKLSQEGLFDEDRKKTLPSFPQRLGVITSRYGAVIHDLLNNLGKYGYKIQLYDTRVEGSLATKELMSALTYFKEQAIDLLVVIRGGGSLESLQPFNHEALVRTAAEYPIPIIAGIGHDQDIPLFSMVADAAFSTPTAVAREINRSWDSALEKLRYYENAVINKYVPLLLRSKHIIHQNISKCERYCLRLSQEQKAIWHLMDSILQKWNQLVEKTTSALYHCIEKIIQRYGLGLEFVSRHLKHQEDSIRKNNPDRLLDMGYSIIFHQDRVISSVHKLCLDDFVKIRLKDGEIHSKVMDIKQRSEHGAIESDENS